MTDDLLTHLVGTRAGVEPTRMFGSAGLKVRGKTFAMVVRGRLVVKLPATRVDDLIATGVAERFDPGHGRLMREWVHLVADDPATWRVLVAEALDFVDASTPDRTGR